MIVNRVKEFIEQLESCDELSTFDQEFLDICEAKFSSLTDNLPLDQPQIDWLLDQIKNRWDKVKDTPLDYTFNPNHENEFWIKLAQDLAPDTLIPYLQILIPTITNTIDVTLLTRLTDCSEFRGFYLSEDGKMLHRVRGLFERLHNRQEFSIFRNVKTYVPSPLSLREMYRLQSKQGDLTFDVHGEIYRNFWDYLVRANMNTWADRGEYPHNMLPGLLEAIECYFNRDFDAFRAKLFEWERDLQYCSVEDVNAFYGQVITVGNRSIYLIELLLLTFQQDPKDMAEHLMALAGWIATLNPAFVSSVQELAPTYRSLHLGSALTVKELLYLIAKLDDSGSLTIRNKLAVLALKLKQQDEIEDDDIVTLGEVYKYRWSKICGGDRDYTRVQKGVNTYWIRLAQVLAGGGFIHTNYYKFLMPTITVDIDPVKKEPLTNYPLNHYILSQDNEDLILLDVSVSRYPFTLTFYNCSSYIPKPFTHKEIPRILFAHKRFHKYHQQMLSDNGVEDSISLRTVFAIKKLVDDSLFTQGLALSYNEEQLTSAEKAYRTFFLDFLELLSDDERQRLNRQRIFLHGRVMRFSEVLSEIEKNECIAVYGQYFAQLVLDYAPWVQFKRDVEDKVCIKSDMRNNSRKKVPQEYASLTEEEAFRRLGILFISIMTRSFQYIMFSGYTETSLGYTNVLPFEVRNVLLPLIGMIDSAQCKHARHLYASIMEGIVKPALADETLMTKMYRYADTKEWLQSIENNTLFKVHSWYEPEVYLDRLLPLLGKSSNSRVRLESFLDDLVQCSFRLNNPISKKLLINIKFNQLLKTLNHQSKAEILEALNTVGNSITSTDFTQLCVKLMTHRLATIFAEEESGYQLGLFSRKEVNIQVYGETLERMKVESPKTGSQKHILNLFQTKLVSNLLPEAETSAAIAMEVYWEKMTGRKLPGIADVQVLDITITA